jgi:probable rRNA maturation factor
MTLNLLIDDPRWRNSFKTLRVDVLKAVRMVLKDYDVKGAIVTLKFSTDEDVETLNHLYRGKKKPTNVLSFPNDEPPLGDIIFAYETVKREAKEQKKTFRAHTLHLVVHATLHLLGYDHEKSKEAEEMEALEIAYLKRLAIANPYETR